MKKTFLSINLRLHDEGGVAATPAIATDSGVATKGEKVVYGKQETPVDNVPVAEEQPKVQPVVDRKAEFEKLIDGEYKDLFTERTQSIINKRFKDTKTYEKQLADYDSTMFPLYSRYGIKPGDVASLQKAIDSDNTLFEQEAEKRGVDVGTLRYIKNLEQQNEITKQQNSLIERESTAQKFYADCLEQAKGMSAEYPDFNLEAECENEQFIGLLKSGVDMKTSYEVIHMNDIKVNVAKQAEQSVANTIKANGQRPTENGVASTTGVTVKSDVSKLTAADRAEIARRASRGETITF